MSFTKNCRPISFIPFASSSVHFPSLLCPEFVAQECGRMEQIQTGLWSAVWHSRTSAGCVRGQGFTAAVVGSGVFVFFERKLGVSDE